MNSISLSQGERLTIYAALHQRQITGGGDALCELWDALRLDECGGKPGGPIDLLALPAELEAFTLADCAFLLALSALIAPGLPLALARVGRRAVLRIAGGR